MKYKILQLGVLLPLITLSLYAADGGGDFTKVRNKKGDKKRAANADAQKASQALDADRANQPPQPSKLDVLRDEVKQLSAELREASDDETWQTAHDTLEAKKAELLKEIATIGIPSAEQYAWYRVKEKMKPVDRVYTDIDRHLEITTELRALEEEAILRAQEGKDVDEILRTRILTLKQKQAQLEAEQPRPELTHPPYEYLKAKKSQTMDPKQAVPEEAAPAKGYQGRKWQPSKDTDKFQAPPTAQHQAMMKPICTELTEVPKRREEQQKIRKYFKANVAPELTAHLKIRQMAANKGLSLPFKFSNGHTGARSPQALLNFLAMQQVNEGSTLAQLAITANKLRHESTQTKLEEAVHENTPTNVLAPDMFARFSDTLVGAAGKEDRPLTEPELCAELRKLRETTKFRKQELEDGRVLSGPMTQKRQKIQADFKLYLNALMAYEKLDKNSTTPQDMKQAAQQLADARRAYAQQAGHNGALLRGEQTFMDTRTHIVAEHTQLQGRLRSA